MSSQSWWLYQAKHILSDHNTCWNWKYWIWIQTNCFFYFSVQPHPPPPPPNQQTTWMLLSAFTLFFFSFLCRFGEGGVYLWQGRELRCCLQQHWQTQPVFPSLQQSALQAYPCKSALDGSFLSAIVPQVVLKATILAKHINGWEKTHYLLGQNMWIFRVIPFVKLQR